MLSRESGATLMSAVTAFIYKEARLQDEHQYEAWEALWTDDGVYWVPANGDDIDPEKEMSIIYDNRSRIALRIRQLLTGNATARRRSRGCGGWCPTSNCSTSNPAAISRSAATHGVRIQSARRHDLGRAQRIPVAPCDGDLRMARKKVILVNNEKALFTLSFLI